MRKIYTRHGDQIRLPSGEWWTVYEGMLMPGVPPHDTAEAVNEPGDGKLELFESWARRQIAKLSASMRNLEEQDKMRGRQMESFQGSRRELEDEALPELHTEIEQLRNDFAGPGAPWVQHMREAKVLERLSALEHGSRLVGLGEGETLRTLTDLVNRLRDDVQQLQKDSTVTVSAAEAFGTKSVGHRALFAFAKWLDAQPLRQQNRDDAVTALQDYLGKDR